MEKRQIAILGSTGSIGTQALEVIAEHPDRFEAYCLTANNNARLLAEQAIRFKPAAVAIADEGRYDELRELLSGEPDIKVYAGEKAIEGLVEAGPVDMVLAAIVGFAGLAPTLHALSKGKAVALANKETLVVAGELVCDVATRHRAPILPVDSEHSAIFQCLAGEGPEAVEKILLTASGGPFLHTDADSLARMTAADALRHPTWNMGAKITIDSATMMNKGFEVMEARWLFGIPAERIEVVIHPQSIVHSAVQFRDGSVRAQLGVPDMRMPIQYALSYPERLHLSAQRLDLTAQPLEFLKPDTDRFRCLALAFEAIGKGGNMPCILNAANEVANAAFRQGRCGFLDVADCIERTMRRVAFDPSPTYDVYVATDKEARHVAAEEIG